MDESGEMNQGYSLVFIPGLGTDPRIFEILLSYLPGNEIIHISHDQSLLASNPSMEDYARELKEKYSSELENKSIILIGFSLGGMVATEMSKILKVEKLILISSLKCRDEFPLPLRWGKYFDFFDYIPLWFSHNIGPILGLISGQINRAAYPLIKSMIKKWTVRGFSGARKMVVSWKNQIVPSDYIHIHGSRDLIIYHSKVKYTHLIKGGTHNMIMQKAKEIASLIAIELQLPSGIK